jgi:hypothetical protein
LFRRRIGGVFVVVVDDDLGEHAHKKVFSHKKKMSLLDNDNCLILVRLPGKCNFSLYF